jgi:hypothetical protein
MGDGLLGGAPCRYRSLSRDNTSNLNHVVHIDFITPTLALLSAWTEPASGQGPPCVAWDAVAVHPESTPVSAYSWSNVKVLFQ